MQRPATLIGLCAMAQLSAGSQLGPGTHVPAIAGTPPPGAPTPAVSVSLALSASGNFRLPQTLSVSTALAASGMFRLPVTLNVPVNLSANGLFAESGGAQ